MAHADASTIAADETLTIDPHRANRLISLSFAVIAFGAVVAVIGAFFFGGLRRLMLSYLVSYMFVLTIALGALFFVLLQHAVKAGWSVNVRRVPELLTRLFPLLAVGAIPIIATFLFPGFEGDREDGKGPLLYPWAMYQVEHHGDDEVQNTAGAETGLEETDREIYGDHDDEADEGDDYHQHLGDNLGGEAAIRTTGSGIENEAFAVASSDDHLLTDERQVLTVKQAEHHAYHIDGLTEGKLGYLNRPFFLVRIVIYFTAWTLLAGYFWRRSTRQDADGNPALTKQMTAASYGGLVVYGLTLTFASFDLVMSLDPHFFSTIFGGYIFSGGVVGFFAATILIYQILRMKGLLKESVTVEHYHDLGKFLFAFVFFWGYIAFSQFMLIWYANIPETTYWFAIRGATSVTANLGLGSWGTGYDAANVGWWTIVSLTLLVGHLLIPFAGLMSRHVKRNLTLLGFWAGWLLVMHWIDLYWLIMPEMLVGGWQLIPVVELGCAMAVIGAAVAWTVREMKAVKLRPARDPRAVESLAFHNI